MTDVAIAKVFATFFVCLVFVYVFHFHDLDTEEMWWAMSGGTAAIASIWSTWPDCK